MKKYAYNADYSMFIWYCVRKFLYITIELKKKEQ